MNLHSNVDIDPHFSTGWIIGNNPITIFVGCKRKVRFKVPNQNYYLYIQRLPIKHSQLIEIEKMWAIYVVAETPEANSESKTFEWCDCNILIFLSVQIWWTPLPCRLVLCSKWRIASCFLVGCLQPMTQSTRDLGTVSSAKWEPSPSLIRAQTAWSIHFILSVSMPTLTTV